MCYVHRIYTESDKLKDLWIEFNMQQLQKWLVTHYNEYITMCNEYITTVNDHSEQITGESYVSAIRGAGVCPLYMQQLF